MRYNGDLLVMKSGILMVLHGDFHGILRELNLWFPMEVSKMESVCFMENPMKIRMMIWGYPYDSGNHYMAMSPPRMGAPKRS